MLKKLLLLPLLCLIIPKVSFSQVSVRDSGVFVPAIYGTYSYAFPGGDLAERFGGHSSIGGGLLFKTASNWVFGAEGNYMFGSTVKNSDSILKNIETREGYLIDQNGMYADHQFSERGYNFSAKFGKVIPVLSSNPNSGIMVIAGAGYMQNKIRIHLIQASVPSVEDDYRKGYDKLNGGFFISESLGYLLMSNSRLTNFYIGFEMMQAWTKSKRDYDFATQMKDTRQYSSQFYGFRIKWMIPLYKRKPNAYYLY